MAGKRNLLRKIASLKNTEKITSAMKMIASTKLQRMRRALADSKPFGDALNDMNARLGLFEEEIDEKEMYSSSSSDKEEEKKLTPHPPEKAVGKQQQQQQQPLLLACQ